MFREKHPESVLPTSGQWVTNHRESSRAKCLQDFLQNLGPSLLTGLETIPGGAEGRTPAPRGGER